MPSMEEYERVGWEDAPSKQTPISAENLNHMDDALASLYRDVAALEETVNNFSQASGSDMTSEVNDEDDVELQPSGSPLRNIFTGIYSRIRALFNTKADLELIGNAVAQRDGLTDGLATTDYAVGDYLIYQNKLYKATHPIVVGDTLVPEENIIDVSLAQEFASFVASQSGEGALSYVGMIIESTTFNTMDKVIEFYGGTQWVLHTGYFLYGASSGVTPGKKTADGGAATVKLTAAECALPSHTHTHGTISTATNGAHIHNMYSKRTNITYAAAGNTHVLCHSSNPNSVSFSGTGCVQSAGGHTHTVSGGAINSATIANATSAHNNMPPYKNVYVWERTA